MPEGRQQLRRRDAALYALSLGLGQDPMDSRDFPFVDCGPGRDLQALPFMAVVLAPHESWIADPRTRIDPVRALYGEVAMTFESALPIGGEVIGRPQIAGLVDKGEGRSALVYLTKDLFDATTGKRIAALESTLFLRGEGGFGGPNPPIKTPIELPARVPDCTLLIPTRPEQALYYRLNGDYNPLHSDPAVAREAGYPRPILHGFCTLGICGYAVLRALCEYNVGRLKSLYARFSAPVLPGDTLQVDIWRDGSFRASVLERRVTVISSGKAGIA